MELDKDRLQWFIDNKFYRWNVIDKYDGIESLNELMTEVKNDYECLSLYQNNDLQEESRLCFNFVSNFYWFLFHSDHNTTPAGLIEDDFNGVSYYEQMRLIYLKLSRNG